MEDLIYARQSVDKEDSISIESQIELCLREVGNRPHRVFRDKGYSGKNTERPDFQDMMAAVRSGGVSRIIVYRLDRISRSVLDFAQRHQRAPEVWGGVRIHHREVRHLDPNRQSYANDCYGLCPART